MSVRMRAPVSRELIEERPGLVARAAIALTAWTERWIPDAFIFALLATLIVVRRRARLDAVDARCRWSMRGATASGT